MKYRIGIDLGGTDIKAGIVDENYNITVSDSTPTRGERTFEAVVADMAMLVGRICERAGFGISELPYVGLGAPSYIDPKTGLLVFFNNASWRNVPLRQALEKHLHVPVRIENDANCAVIGERLAGAGKGHENIVMLTLGTGVGAGVIMSGRLFAGADGMGTELGHTPLVHGGTRCTCGMDGCLEAYASVRALTEQTKAAMAEHPESAMHEFVKTEGGRVTGRTSFECARAGDEAALAVVREYIDYLAHGLGGFVNIFRPETVLIGGGLSNAGEFLLEPLREQVKQYIHSYFAIGGPDIVAAKLGNDAGMIGAAFLDGR